MKIPRLDMSYRLPTNTYRGGREMPLPDPNASTLESQAIAEAAKDITTIVRNFSIQQSEYNAAKLKVIRDNELARINLDYTKDLWDKITALRLNPDPETFIEDYNGIYENTRKQWAETIKDPVVKDSFIKGSMLEQDARMPDIYSESKQVFLNSTEQTESKILSEITSEIIGSSDSAKKASLVEQARKIIWGKAGITRTPGQTDTRWKSFLDRLNEEGVKKKEVEWGDRITRGNIYKEPGVQPVTLDEIKKYSWGEGIYIEGEGYKSGDQVYEDVASKGVAPPKTMMSLATIQKWIKAVQEADEIMLPKVSNPVEYGRIESMIRGESISPDDLREEITKSRLLSVQHKTKFFDMVDNEVDKRTNKAINSTVEAMASQMIRNYGTAMAKDDLDYDAYNRATEELKERVRAREATGKPMTSAEIWKVGYEDLMPKYKRSDVQKLKDTARRMKERSESMRKAREQMRAEEEKALPPREKNETVEGYINRLLDITR